MDDRPKENNLTWHQATLKREHRERRNGHKSVAIWFTGLSGAGKSTLAHAVEEELYRRGCHTFVFDGDNVRHGLCSDLGFSREDRAENIRRIGEMIRLFVEAGTIALSAFISPFRSDRKKAKDLISEKDFIEVYCRCDLEVCERRDVKGLYRAAREGRIKDFTGISSPYEEPENPAIVVDTAHESLEQCVAKILNLLEERGIAPRRRV